MLKRPLSVLIAVIVMLAFSAACKKDANIGTQKDPIKISFMPSADKAVMAENAKIFTDELSKVTGLKIEPVMAPDYLSIIDAMASGNTDIAFINPLGYLLAHDWCGAEAVFQLKGTDKKTDYQSAIIANIASGISAITDLEGKKFAYTDPYSMAGYLMPLWMLTEANVKPASTTYLNKYDAVVESVYLQKQDAGAIFYHKPDPYGRINDARAKLVEKYSDTLEKVKVVALSEPIPNSTVMFRKNLKPELSEALSKAFDTVGASEAGIAALGKMYDATGFGPADNDRYAKIREMLKKLGKDPKEVVPGALTFYRKNVWEVVPSY